MNKRELFSLFGIGLLCILSIMVVLDFIIVAITLHLDLSGWVGTVIGSTLAATLFAFIAAAIANLAGKLPLRGDE